MSDIYAAFDCRVYGPVELRDEQVSDAYLTALEGYLFPYTTWRQQYVYRRREVDHDLIYMGLEDVFEDEFNKSMIELDKRLTAAGVKHKIDGIYEVDCERWRFDVKDGEIREEPLVWFQELSIEELRAIKEFHERWGEQHEKLNHSNSSPSSETRLRR